MFMQHSAQRVSSCGAQRVFAAREGRAARAGNMSRI